MRYPFQSSLWGLRAKSDISTNLTLAQENLKSLKKEESGSRQGQSCEKVGEAMAFYPLLKAFPPLPPPYLAGFGHGPAPLTKQKAITPNP